MDPDALVRRYYEALDDRDYDRLERLLAPSFVQRRPDRTFDDRNAFVRFMRDERPMRETTHELVDVFAAADGERATARGRLIDAGGEVAFEFADVFELEVADGGDEGGRIVRLDTYTR